MPYSEAEFQKVLAQKTPPLLPEPVPQPSFIQALAGQGLPPQPPVPYFPSRLPTGPEIARGTMAIGRPALEMGGLTAGGLLGATMGLYTGLAGAGLGYAGGQALATGLEEATGMTPIAPVSQRLLEAAKAVPVGIALEAGGQVVGRGFMRGLQTAAAPFAKTMTPAATALAEQAQATGLDLTAAEITKNKPLALFESLLDKVPFSSGMIQRFRLKQLNNLTAQREALIENGGNPLGVESLGYQIKYQVDQAIKKFEGMRQSALDGIKNRLLAKVGSQESYEQLGMQGQAAIAARADAVNEATGALRDKVGQLLPSGAIIETPTFRQVASDLLDQKLKMQGLQNVSEQAALAKMAGQSDPVVKKFLSQLPPGPASEALRQQIMDQTIEPISYPTYQLMRTELGHRAVAGDLSYQTTQPGMAMLSNPMAGDYKRLRNALDIDFAVVVEAVGGEAKELWDMSNALYRQGKQFVQSPVVKRILKSNPGVFTDLLVSPGHEAVTNIRLVRREVGEAAFQPVRDAVSRKLLQMESGQPFSPATLSKEMLRLGDATLSEVYPASDLLALKALTADGIAIESLPLGNKFFKELLTRDPKSVVNLVVRPNDTRSLALIRPIIGETGMQQLRQATLEKVLALNPQERFSPARFSTAISRLGTTTTALLGEQTSRALRELATLGRATQGAEALAGNPSGTAQNLIMFTAGGVLLRGASAAVGALSGYSTGQGGRGAAIGAAAGLLLGPPALAKLYLSPVGRRYLSLGYQLPVESPMAAEVTAKILGVLGMSPERPPLSNSLFRREPDIPSITKLSHLATLASQSR